MDLSAHSVVWFKIELTIELIIGSVWLQELFEKKEFFGDFSCFD